MSTTMRTNFNKAANGKGLTDSSGNITGVLNHGQVLELYEIADAAGVKVAVDGTQVSFDTWVLAPAASQSNTITVQSTKPGTQIAAGVKSIQIADNGSDTLSVTYTSGAVKINLANSTDSNNTLTLILAALNALNTSTNGAVLSAFITGTASTQMVHGGTNTVAATVAGGSAAGGLKSSTAGIPTPITITPSS